MRGVGGNHKRAVVTTACIVQGHLASSRFPGKVLKHIAGRTVLGHVLRRSAAIPGIDVVVCATVDGPDGERIGKEAEAYGAIVFRGSEPDVLARFREAAR